MFLNHLKAHCEHKAPLPKIYQCIFSKNKDILLYNHNVIINDTILLSTDFIQILPVVPLMSFGVGGPPGQSDNIILKDYCSQAKSGQPPVSLNKVELEHRHVTHLHTVYG